MSINIEIESLMLNFICNLPEFSLKVKKRRHRATFVDNLLIDTEVETTGELETLLNGIEKSHPGSSGSSR